MLKKFMFFFMVVLTAARFTAASYVLSLKKPEAEALPLAIYISMGIVVIAGIVLICKRFITKVSKREMELYYLLTALAVVFNLIFMKVICRIDVTLVEFLVVGTIMDVVISVTLIFMAERERKYIRIPVHSGQ